MLFGVVLAIVVVMRIWGLLYGVARDWPVDPARESEMNRKDAREVVAKAIKSGLVSECAQDRRLTTRMVAARIVQAEVPNSVTLLMGNYMEAVDAVENAVRGPLASAILSERLFGVWTVYPRYIAGVTI